MNWHEELISRGFVVLVSNTTLKYYGFYKNDKYIFSGTIEYERKGKILEPDFEPHFVSGRMTHKYYPADAEEVFYPFISERVGDATRLTTAEELDNYINAELEKG